VSLGRCSLVFICQENWWASLWLSASWLVGLSALLSAPERCAKPLPRNFEFGPHPARLCIERLHLRERFSFTAVSYVARLQL
jgi:hypothetical protein